MPATILTSLLIWATWLAPGVGSDPVDAAGLDRAAIRTARVDSPTLVRPWLLQERCSWTISEAGIEEEESGEGDSDGLPAVESWIRFPASRQGYVSTSCPDHALARSSVRSPILRC